MSVPAAMVSVTLADLVQSAESGLQTVTDSARFEAQLLVAAAVGVSRATVMAYAEREADQAAVVRYEQMLARRSRGEPLAYILGSREFYSLNFCVSPDVLVPRPETELLVDAVLGRLPGDGAAVLDLGTGSGAIALALKKTRPDLRMVAADRSAAALDVARANGERLGIEVEWLQSDWFSGLEGEGFDLVVSNPPYVRTNDPHFNGPLSFEPREALDGGPDGLDAYREILARAPQHLTAGGQVILEHGFDQREALRQLADDHDFEWETGIDDLSGQPRVACLKLKSQ